MDIDTDLMRALADAPVAFGLVAQGHIPTIERMIVEGASWEEIAREIGWDEATVRQHYVWSVQEWRGDPESA